MKGFYNRHMLCSIRDCYRGISKISNKLLLRLNLLKCLQK